jgi:hypothetical protein
MTLLTAVIAISLAAVHLLAGKLRFLNAVPRSQWLSIASGVSVAYVFVHILPDLARGQHHVQATGQLRFIEHHVYLLALFGMMAFYGLELLVRRHRRKQGDEESSPGVFWVHMVSFALYNTLIGYLLVHRDEPGGQNLLFFVIAIGMHFIVNDFGLRDHHHRRYDHIGRWVLAAAVVAGWGLGLIGSLSKALTAVFFAVLAGAIILNVLKEELPEDRRSRFWAFASAPSATPPSSCCSDLRHIASPSAFCSFRRFALAPTPTYSDSFCPLDHVVSVRTGADHVPTRDAPSPHHLAGRMRRSPGAAWPHVSSRAARYARVHARPPQPGLLLPPL